MKGFYIEVTNNLLEKKHIKQIGSAVWVFMWCLDKITKIEGEIGYILGGTEINLSDIREELGLNEGTISENLSKLEKFGYITKTLTSHGIILQVNKAKKRFGRKVVSVNPNDRSEKPKPHSEKPKPYNIDNTIDNNKDISVSMSVDNSIKEKKLTKIQLIVNYFYELKKWPLKNGDGPKRIYARYTGAAKDLLELCEDNEEEAKECLKKLADWAINHELDWGIETVFKKWYDLDRLKFKEKKSYLKDGRRIFKKAEKGWWYVIDHDGMVKQWDLPLNQNDIIWK